MGAIIALKVGLTDPRAGLNILLRIVFGGEAELAEVLQELESLANSEEPRSWLSAVINWMLFGPLLYLWAAPAYYFYALVSFIAAQAIPTGDALQYAFSRTWQFMRTGLHTFFLTGFALQAIRICLMTAGVPADALSIKLIEESLNIFFTICAAPSGSLRWVRKRPGRDNWLWLIFAFFATILIYDKMSSWSPAWKLTTLHFVLFVGLAGPKKRRGAENPAVKYAKEVEIYQKQALLVASVLGLIFALTKTANWTYFYKLVAILAAALGVIYAFNENANVNAKIIYVDDPHDRRIERSEMQTMHYLALIGSTILSVIVCLAIANWPWYYKWPLIITLSFFVFLHLGVIRRNAGLGKYAKVKYVPRQQRRRAPEPPQQIEHGGDDNLYDEASDGWEEFRPGRLPVALANIGPFPTQRQSALLHWYRYVLEARLYWMGLNRRQCESVAHRVVSLMNDDDIVNSFTRIDILQRNIDEALRIERRNNPDFELDQY